MTAHWTDAYYGALYLETVEDLLTPRLSAVEADAIASLLETGPRDRVLDLACGHGRHARVLAGRVGWLCGTDRSGDYLRRATSAPITTSTRTSSSAATPSSTRGPTYLRADVRALPFGPAAFDAAYSWYSSLFMFDDATNAATLAEAARVVRTGGRLLVHHANPLALARTPHEEARRTLSDGSVVEEVSEFDAAAGVDRCARRLTRPTGAVLAGTAVLRYYSPAEWRPLARAAGLHVLALTTTSLASAPAGTDIGPEAPDLVAVLEKKTP